MSVFVPYLMQIICIFLTFLSTFFPSIDHSCQYCDTCQHTGGTATCISRAVCDECGEEYGAPLGHSMNLIAAKAATCIAEGNNKYYYCKNCDTFFADAAGKQETSVENMTIAINPDAHVWNGGSVTTEASCCVMGVKTYVCTLNSVHTKTEEIGYNANNHINTKEIAAVDATCDTIGYTAGVFCVDCDAYISGHVEVPALGHDMKETAAAVAPTCTEAGKTAVLTCANNCGKTEGGEEVAALGHTEETIPAVDATCEATGLTAGVKCAVCGEILTAQEAVPVLGHTPAEAVEENRVESTCTVAGSYESVVYCSVCGEELSRETVALELADHTEGAVVVENEVAATCTAEGSYDNVVYCTACNAELSRETITVDKIAHDYEAVVTAPTCTEDGYTTYTCSACGDSYVADEVDALGHTESEAVEENRTESTCTVAGSYDSVVYCSVCGEELSRETVALELASHTAGEVVVENEVAATCTADGSYDNVVYCTVCNAELSRNTVTVDKIAHDYEAVVTAPTCTEDGYTTYTCSACGDSYVADEVAALGHTPAAAVEENRTESTCTVAGSYDSVVYCSVCGAELSRDTVALELADHTEGAVVVENEKAATCTAEGSYDNVVYCTVCNAELSRNTVTVDKIAHTPAAAVEENRTESTCTVAGSYDSVVYCSVCDEELSRETITVEKIAHTPAEAVEENRTESTCTVAGSYDSVVYCSVCDAELSRENVALELADHTEGAVVVENEVAATCTAEGSYDNVVYCTVCNAELSRNTVTVDKIAHDYEAVVTAPTCTEDGYTTYICSACGDSYVADEVDALGHTESEAVEENRTESTCTVAGSYESVVYCSVCDEELSREEKEVAALGHTLTQVEAKAATCTEDGYKAYEYCSVCDYTTYEKVDKLGHAYNAVVTDPTCEDDGYTTHTCTRCSDSYKDTYTDATGHNYTSAVTKAATCTEDGVRTYTCSNNASHTYTEAITKLGHNYATTFTVDVQGTCTTDGSKSKHCSRCDAKTEVTTITARGHNIVDTTVKTAATCTTDGVMNQKCSNSSAFASLTSEYANCTYTTTRAIPATGHSKVSVAAQTPTCTEIGWNAYEYCSNCDYTTYSEIASLGHSFTAYTDYKPATCSKDATKIASCDNGCGTTDVQIKPNTCLSHTTTDADNNNICDTCGEQISFRFDPLEYPEEAIVEKNDPAELAAYLDRAKWQYEGDPTTDPTLTTLYATTKGHDDNGIIYSPYFDVKIEGQNIPVYGTVVYAPTEDPEHQENGHGALHSFAEIYTNASEPNQTFKVSLTSVWDGFDIERAEILGAYGYENNTVRVVNGEVTATLTGQGVYTFVFNGQDVHYVFTLTVRQYYDDDATIALLRDTFGYTVDVYEGYVEDFNYSKITNATAPHGGTTQQHAIYFKQGTYISVKHNYELNSTIDSAYYSEAGATDNGFGQNRYAVFSAHDSGTVYIYGYGAVDMTHLDRGERRGFLFTFTDSVNILGAKLINPCEWALILYRCGYANINDVDIYGYRRNSDAFDICNSKNVTVNRCFVRSGDDSFVVKALGGDENAVVDGVTVRDCYAWTSKARAFGIFGEVNRNISNVTFENCVVLCHDATWDENLIPAIGIVATNSDNPTVFGEISNITFNNIEICKNEASPINCISSLPNTMHDLTFNNIKIASNNKSKGYPIRFEWFNGGNIYNVTFAGVSCNGTEITCTTDGSRIGNWADYLYDATSCWIIFEKKS